MSTPNIDLSQLQPTMPNLPAPTPAMPTYTGSAYAAPAGSPAAQAATAPPSPDAPPSIASLLGGNQQPQQAPLTSALSDPQQEIKQQTMQLAPQIYQAQMPTGKGLKGMLQRFAYNGGQAAMKSVGLKTDQELQADSIQQAHIQAQTQLVQQQIQQAKTTVPVQFPNGTIGYYPQAIAAKLQGQVVGANAKTGVAQIGADSRTAMNNINAQLKARGIGVQLDFDDNGNPVMKNQTQEELAAPVAAKMQGKKNEIGLIQGALSGNTDDASALKVLQANRMALVRERGNAFGQARLWALQKVLDPKTGQTSLRTGFDVLNAQKNGENLIPVGGLSQKDVISVQQLQSEAAPAISAVRQNLGAFDNAGDRAIFARVLKSAGAPKYGDEAGWMGNVVNQAAKENLSPQGQAAARSLSRLAETMGRLRSTLGGPATDTQMALAMQLLPGASTPNSKYAGEQLDQLQQMITQAANIPAYGGTGAGGGSKPSGGPAVGSIKKFPNGNIGKWDGKGYVLQGSK